MLNFGQKVDERNNELIPKDTLLWCQLVVRGLKNSRNTNGKMLDLELVVLPGQPYAGRKMWTLIADPFDGNNSEEFRKMGYGQIRRILEGVFGSNPNNPASYNLQSYDQFNGITVPCVTVIEKGKDGFDDKNKPEFLSPYSSVKKIVDCFNLLKAGVNVYEKKDDKKPAGGTPVAQTSGFTAPPAAPTAGMAPPQPQVAAGNGPGWLAPTPSPAAAPQPAVATTGFIPPAQPAAAPPAGYAVAAQGGGFNAPQAQAAQPGFVNPSAPAAPPAQPSPGVNQSVSPAPHPLPSNGQTQAPQATGGAAQYQPPAIGGDPVPFPPAAS